MRPGCSAPRRDRCRALADLPARRLARAVGRAASRLPGETRCLEQAVALAWMLRRRAMGSAVVFGVHPETRRGDLGDLHAWVVRGREILIGLGDGDHRPIAAFAFEP
ncbi:MAG: lasso peptide biosynthesis B2 protein [Novosphingobium sp.]|nr:lasso peptide biosynthesis B2 protein [Novosphingobium sp.]